MNRRRYFVASFLPLIAYYTAHGYLPPPPAAQQFHTNQDYNVPSASSLLPPAHHPRNRISSLLYATTDKDKDETKKGSSRTGDLIRSVGGIFSSSNKAEEKETQEEEKRKGWLNMFRRKDSEDDKSKKKVDDEKTTRGQAFKDAVKRAKDVATFQAAVEAVEQKQEVGKAKKEQKPEQREEKKRKEKERASSSSDKKDADTVDSDRFGLSRVQGYLPFRNATATNKGEQEAKDDSKNSTNPFSAMQRFASSFWKGSSSATPKEEWIPVFPKTRIMPGEVKPVTVAGLDLLVIASNDGRSLYCIANSCPHLGTPLETGKLTRLPIEDKKSSGSSSLVSTKNNDFGAGMIFSETDISSILQQDGCEDCIVCPLHQTAFALKSGEVRGEWCPYPPLLGPAMGMVKPPTPVAVFNVRTRAKNIEVRLNSVIVDDANEKGPKKKPER